MSRSHGYDRYTIARAHRSVYSQLAERKARYGEFAPSEALSTTLARLRNLHAADADELLTVARVALRMACARIAYETEIEDRTDVETEEDASWTEEIERQRRDDEERRAREAVES